MSVIRSLGPIRFTILTLLAVMASTESFAQQNMCDAVKSITAAYASRNFSPLMGTKSGSNPGMNRTLFKGLIAPPQMSCTLVESIRSATNSADYLYSCGYDLPSSAAVVAKAKELEKALEACLAIKATSRDSYRGTEYELKGVRIIIRESGVPYGLDLDFRS